MMIIMIIIILIMRICTAAAKKQKSLLNATVSVKQMCLQQPLEAFVLYKENSLYNDTGKITH